MSFKLKVYISLFIGFLMGLTISHSMASRNSSGTMSLVAGNPVVTNTPISSTWANNTLSDIANELTDSLSRTGKGAMSAQFQSIDGSLGAPGMSFATETGSGLRRASAGNICLTVGATDIICSTTAGPTVALPFQGVNSFATGPTTFTGTAANAPVILTPLAAPSAPSNGALWVETTANKVKARINGATQTLVTTPILRTDLPTVGQQISSSSGSYTQTTATITDVTNLAVTITTTGRPVMLMLQAAGSSSAQIGCGGATSAVCSVIFDRAGTIATYIIGSLTDDRYGSFVFLDPVGAGTYTYKVRFSADGTRTAFVTNMALAAYEL